MIEMKMADVRSLVPSNDINPKAEPCGALVTYVQAPAGLLFHLAQWTG